MASIDDTYANIVELTSAADAASMGAAAFAHEISAKALVIAAAGDLEQRFTGLMISLFQEAGTPDHLVEFVGKQALKRKFHTLFVWDGKNVNSFLGLFGDDRKELVKDRIEQEDLQNEMLSFLKIVNERNLMAHNGLASYSLEYTHSEVKELYDKAVIFTTKVGEFLK